MDERGAWVRKGQLENRPLPRRGPACHRLPDLREQRGDPEPLSRRSETSERPPMNGKRLWYNSMDSPIGPPVAPLCDFSSRSPGLIAARLAQLSCGAARRRSRCARPGSPTGPDLGWSEPRDPSSGGLLQATAPAARASVEDHFAVSAAPGHRGAGGGGTVARANPAEKRTRSRSQRRQPGRNGGTRRVCRAGWPHPVDADQAGPIPIASLESAPGRHSGSPVRPAQLLGRLVGVNRTQHGRYPGGPGISPLSQRLFDAVSPGCVQRRGGQAAAKGRAGAGTDARRPSGGARATLWETEIHCFRAFRMDATRRVAQRVATAGRRIRLSAEDVVVLHGPPGTGKTTTVIEVIRQVIRQDQKVLAYAPSNLAVDNLLERLFVAGENAVRLGHPCVLPELREHTLDLVVEQHPDVRLANKLLRDSQTLRDRSMRYTRASRRRGRNEKSRGGQPPAQKTPAAWKSRSCNRSSIGPPSFVRQLRRWTAKSSAGGHSTCWSSMKPASRRNPRVGSLCRAVKELCWPVITASSRQLSSRSKRSEKD